MLKGSCLCGKVAYQYDGEIDEISMCHCKDCQKAQGSAFSAVAPIQSRAFQVTQGEAFLRSFRATPDKVRVFCHVCGSPIYSARDTLPDVKRLRIGTLDTPVNASHKYHAFVSSHVPWLTIDDGLPQFVRFKT